MEFGQEYRTKRAVMFFKVSSETQRVLGHGNFGSNIAASKIFNVDISKSKADLGSSPNYETSPVKGWNVHFPIPSELTKGQYIQETR